MALIKRFEIETGIDLFPKMKTVFFDDDHYVIAVDVNYSELVTPFVLFKPFVLSACGYTVVLEDLGNRLNYFFSNKKQNAKKYMKSLTKEYLLEKYNERIHAYDIETISLFKDIDIHKPLEEWKAK